MGPGEPALGREAVWLLQPPLRPGGQQQPRRLHGGVWTVVCLAALTAMDSGRRALVAMHLEREEARRREGLGQEGGGEAGDSSRCGRRGACHGPPMLLCPRWLLWLRPRPGRASGNCWGTLLSWASPTSPGMAWGGRGTLSLCARARGWRWWCRPNCGGVLGGPLSFAVAPWGLALLCLPGAWPPGQPVCFSFWFWSLWAAGSPWGSALCLCWLPCVGVLAWLPFCAVGAKGLVFLCSLSWLLRGQ